MFTSLRSLPCETERMDVLKKNTLRYLKRSKGTCTEWERAIEGSWFFFWVMQGKGRLMSHCRHENQRQKTTLRSQQSLTQERVGRRGDRDNEGLPLLCFAFVSALSRWRWYKEKSKYECETLTVLLTFTRT